MKQESWGETVKAAAATVVFCVAWGIVLCGR